MGELAREDAGRGVSVYIEEEEEEGTSKSLLLLERGRLAREGDRGEAVSCCAEVVVVVVVLAVDDMWSCERWWGVTRLLYDRADSKRRS